MKDKEYIFMDRAKCNSGCKDSSNPDRIITECNKK